MIKKAGLFAIVSINVKSGDGVHFSENVLVLETIRMRTGYSMIFNSKYI